MRSYMYPTPRLADVGPLRVCVKSLNAGKQSINGDDSVSAFILKPNERAPCVFRNIRKCIIIVYIIMYRCNGRSPSV